MTSTLNNGERQVAPMVEGIRRDHVARYEWAAQEIARRKPGARILDLACGVGYGAKILAQGEFSVMAVDRDAEAIAYAKRHYADPGVTHVCEDIAEGLSAGGHDVAVCFETIEHIEEPLALLQSLRAEAPLLLASVPNEDVMPFGGGYAFHFRHYTRGQFEALLKAAGWRVVEWWGQAGPESEVERNISGRTLIAVCIRESAAQRAQVKAPVPERAPRTAPKHVSIVGLGPSSQTYIAITRGMGGRHKYCDETWVINAFGDVLAHDRVFHMDDVRIQQIRADAAPESNIAAMLEWLKHHPGPVSTSRAHVEYPGLVEFPLEDVVNEFPLAYFNSTAAYAVAYAVHLGVEKISLFGCDFSYAKSHDAEKGRACVEFWLGIAAQRGIQLAMPKTTTLMDACNTQNERFYGYDCVELSINKRGDRTVIEFTEKEALPSAEEIEHAYDHSRHTNALAESGHFEAPEVVAHHRAPEVK
jgi:SAM-dependent methyltransferase